MQGDFKMFQQDSKVSAVLGLLWQLICLEGLTLLCCLPIITAGASITAMHYVLLRLVRREESYLAKDFFRAFRENLGASTVIWLIKLAFLIPMGANYLLLRQDPNALPRPVAYMTFIAGFLALMILAFAFPLQSHFVNSIVGTLSNSLRLAITQFPRAFVMTFIWVLPPWLLIHVLLLFPLILLLGLTGPGYLCARLYEPVFYRLEPGHGEEEKPKKKG